MVGDAVGGTEEELSLPGVSQLTVVQCLQKCRERGADGFTIVNNHGSDVVTLEQVVSSYGGRCWCEYGNDRNNGNIVYRTARIHQCGESSVFFSNWVGFALLLLCKNACTL